MNPARISVWMWNQPFIALTLMIRVAAIVMIETSLMRAGAYAARCEGARFLGTAVARDFEGPADAILHSMDSPTRRGESGWRLQRHWRLMGCWRRQMGMLLYGICTELLRVGIAGGAFSLRPQQQVTGSAITSTLGLSFTAAHSSTSIASGQQTATIAANF
jgi:hypothetical protein